ncbi:hypothetical protein HPB52_021851 [Rhipicephalus sanguineus]|uniref:Tr-type G domain-containing protein n=1 Tax=Rhipicephalus sanguineus TaxID=34632 RepID=A0A9D4SRD4_RHISA|nr:hypothetical protein HPB52_021851 [Rhipicephalus sanguineus]
MKVARGGCKGSVAENKSNHRTTRNFHKVSGYAVFSVGFFPVVQSKKRHCSTTSASNYGKERKYDIDPSQFPQNVVRNFCIVAHVDHGKSTLSDRLLELTGTIKPSRDNQQVLDRLPVERERGITVKAQTASMVFHKSGHPYLLNLIDTPGHVDFSYEVLRSVSVCQGVILLVDANQGVQAQTVANFNIAFSSDLAIIPVLNKIDLKNADVQGVTAQMENLFGIDEKDVLKVSAKEGVGIEELVNAIIERIPPPNGNPDAPFRGILLDSWYDRYRGVIALIIAIDGTLRPGDEIVSHATGTTYTVRDLGFMNPLETSTALLCTGHAGYLVANMRSPKEAHIDQMEADLRKERERRAELEERVKALMTLDSGPEQCEAKGKGNTESQAETGKKGDLGAAVAHVGTGDSRRKSYSDVARQSSGGAKQGAPAAGSLSRESGTLSERGISGREQDHSNRKPEANDWTVEGS